MSTQYQSGKDVPTEILVARLNELAHVVARKRDRIGDEFTMRIPAECDRDADLVMSEAARRLSAAPAVQSKQTRHKKPMSYPNGLDMESMPGLVEALEIIEKGEDTGPDGWGAFRWADCRNIARAALAAHRKQQEGQP